VLPLAGHGLTGATRRGHKLVLGAWDGFYGQVQA
jgi:hypothetical protein